MLDFAPGPAVDVIQTFLQAIFVLDSSNLKLMDYREVLALPVGQFSQLFLHLSFSLGDSQLPDIEHFFLCRKPLLSGSKGFFVSGQHPLVTDRRVEPNLHHFYASEGQELLGTRENLGELQTSFSISR